jgi:transposase
MSNSYARIEGGQRIKMPIPFNHGPQYSMIGAISISKVEAALYGKWATNGDIFYCFIENSLLPQLNQKHIVIMDNVKFHLQARIKEAIESVGAKIIFLPPYSPDYNPIENMWSKIKTTLRKIAPRTTRGFKKAIKIAFEGITKSDLVGWFKHCGYKGGLSIKPL